MNIKITESDTLKKEVISSGLFTGNVVIEMITMHKKLSKLLKKITDKHSPMEMTDQKYINEFQIILETGVSAVLAKKEPSIDTILNLLKMIVEERKDD